MGMGPDRRNRPTLPQFVDDVWAPRARRRLASKTWERDDVVYRKHIKPYLGGRPIASLDIEDLAEWQDELERSGVGAPTMIKAIGIVSSIFREAARRPRSTGVQGNPVSLLERPSAKRRRLPLVWGPVVIERVRRQLLLRTRRVGPGKELMAMRDALLVSLMEMTGCRPGEALALRWRDIGERIVIGRALSGREIADRTKTGASRSIPIIKPLRLDLAALREHAGASADDYVFSSPASRHWVETDWRNYRSRHFVPALERVEAEWGSWRAFLARPDDVRESVAGLARTRPYDLGRHTHSALMLASGMTLQRLARIQGHSIRVLDQTYSEQLAEFEDSDGRIDPVHEIEQARMLVWAGKSCAGSAKRCSGC
jgi:integrase